VQRLRVRYTKRGRLRFISHRDFARAFERAIHRSGVPIAFSAGFSPHPKVSYAGAAPTGAASEAEYLEIGLAEQRDPEWVREALDAALPDGLDVVQVVAAEPGGPALADRIEASTWRIRLPGVSIEAGEAALATFLALDELLVERPTKNGTREVDARAAVVAAGMANPTSGAETEACATLDVVLRHLTPAVRPDDIVTALRRAAGLSTPAAPVATRLAQGLLEAEPPQAARHLVDPLG
jgi:radical SAM-linked protein